MSMPRESHNRPSSPIYSSPIDNRVNDVITEDVGYYLDPRNGKKEHIYESLCQDSIIETARKIREVSTKKYRAPQPESVTKPGPTKPPLPETNYPSKTLSSLYKRQPLSERSNRPLSSVLVQQQQSKCVQFKPVSPQTVHSKSVLHQNRISLGEAEDFEFDPSFNLSRRSVYFADQSSDRETDQLANPFDWDSDQLANRRTTSCDRVDQASSTPRKSRKDIFLFWKSNKNKLTTPTKSKSYSFFCFFNKVVIAQWLARQLAIGEVLDSNLGKGENLVIFD